MNIRKILVLMLLAVVVAPAYGGRAPPSDAELRVMPSYCKTKFGKSTPAENSRWQRTFGRGNWVSMHHYCGAILEEMRAGKITERKYRNRALRGARDGYANHLAETEKSHILRYEIYFRLAKISQRLDDAPAAMQAYHKSIRLKPDYMRSYMGLSDVYRDSGQHKEALEIVNKGLARKPKSKGLLRRQKALEKQQKAG